MHGREPTAWFDKACLVPSEAYIDLGCLPVYIMACKRMLILSGLTYTKRLWCIWELYTFFSLCPDNSNTRLVIISLDGENHTQRMLSEFEVDEAHCTSRTDETKLREIIQAGGTDLFEETIRGLADQADEAFSDPVGVQQDVICGCKIQR